MNNKLVKAGYDQVAKRYFEFRDQFKNQEHLAMLAKFLEPGNTVLDVGCGSGVPVDQFLIDHGFEVIGFDLSPQQIQLAKANIPQATYMVKDMADLKTGEFKVEAIVSFYAIFHIERKHHQGLLLKLASFLPTGGLLLITMGSDDWQGTEDFLGAPMFWSHFGPEKNRKLVENAGFQVILDEINDSGGEKHQVILAQKM